MLWLKAFHIIFVVCWFAGLFYLPRIFVYYAASEHQVTRAQLGVMARKLYRFVGHGSIVAVDPRDRRALAGVSALRPVRKRANVAKGF